MRAREILGRDLKPGESGIYAIVTALNRSAIKAIGTCDCAPQENNWKAHCFCKTRNFLFRIGLIKGSNGILFVSEALSRAIGGYDKNKTAFEHIDFIKRALAHGGEWIYIRDICVLISMRRYENNGYLKTLLWWLLETIRDKTRLPFRWIQVTSLRKKK